MKPSFISIVIVCFLSGIFWYAWITDHIIFRSFLCNSALSIAQKKITRSITVYYHKDPSVLSSETIRIIWSDSNQTLNAFHITQAFFDTIFNEQIIEHPLVIQSTLCDDQTNTLYISFDQSPFNIQSSVYKKWMMIEDLLLTLRKNKITQQYVQFLIHHQIFKDVHLDFLRAWPIQGFMESQKY